MCRGFVLFPSSATHRICGKAQFIPVVIQIAVPGQHIHRRPDTTSLHGKNSLRSAFPRLIAKKRRRLSVSQVQESQCWSSSQRLSPSLPWQAGAPTSDKALSEPSLASASAFSLPMMPEWPDTPGTQSNFTSLVRASSCCNFLP